MVTQDPMEVFDGVMLSDGSIRPTANSARFHMPQAGENHMDWLRIIASSLTKLGIDVDEPRLETMTYRGKPYLYSYLRTRVSSFLHTQLSRWYKNRRKVVPEDLVLTPQVLAHWFMGDGSSNWYQRKLSHRKYVYAYLHTCGFTEGDVLVLKEKLAGLSMPKWIMFPKARGFSLQLSEQHNVSRLMELTIPFIVPSYMYKAKMPTELGAGGRICGRSW